MATVGALTAVIATSAVGQSVGLDSAIKEAEAGRLITALRAAEGDPDPLRRCQGQVFVLTKAGDLSGALSAARLGLSLRADDMWLLERACSLAIALRDTPVAQDALAHLTRVVDQADLDSAERIRWSALVEEYSTAVAELTLLADSQAAARRLARWTIFAAGGALIAALCWFALSQQKKPPQRSVDSQGRPSSPGFS